MSNTYFQFKQFIIHQDRCAMKVTTDSCLFGAWAADQINNEESIINDCLDIGTGTGLLSLMLAQKTSANFDAIEIDQDAFEQAKANAAASPWPERIHIIHGDARDLSPGKKYDIIISNPPFYENELKGESKKKNIAHHSDDLPLSELLAIIKNNLSANGAFFLLLPYKRNEEIKRLVREKELSLQAIVFVKQSTRHDHFRIMISGKLKPPGYSETLLGEIVIKDDNDNYTTPFIELLKGYYSTL